MLFHRGPMGDPADSHIATTYAMLAAQSLGLGSCWIGTSVVLNHHPQLKQKYRIPKDNEVTGMLVIGYPAVGMQRSLRRELASVDYV